MGQGLGLHRQQHRPHRQARAGWRAAVHVERVPVRPDRGGRADLGGGRRRRKARRGVRFLRGETTTE